MNSIGRRVILYSVEAYLDDINDERTYQYESLLKLRGGIRTYMHSHRFSNDEYKVVSKLAETPTMIGMSEMEIDRTIFAIELMYLYVYNIDKSKRAHIGMSDKKIYNLKSIMTFDLIKLKRTKPKSHSRVSDLVVETRVAAKKYYGFIDQFMEEE